MALAVCSMVVVVLYVVMAMRQGELGCSIALLIAVAICRSSVEVEIELYASPAVLGSKDSRV